VRVRVLEVNEALNRISLSMKSLAMPGKPKGAASVQQPKPKPAASIQDLMARFNRK
jgi:hypothetical protein